MYTRYGQKVKCLTLVNSQNLEKFWRGDKNVGDAHDKLTVTIVRKSQSFKNAVTWQRWMHNTMDY